MFLCGFIPNFFQIWGKNSIFLSGGSQQGAALGILEVTAIFCQRTLSIRSSQHGHLPLQDQQVDLSFQSVKVESYNIMKLWKWHSWHSITFAIISSNLQILTTWRSGESQGQDWWWGGVWLLRVHLVCVYLRRHTFLLFPFIIFGL